MSLLQASVRRASAATLALSGKRSVRRICVVVVSCMTALSACPAAAAGYHQDVIICGGDPVGPCRDTPLKAYADWLGTWPRTIPAIAGCDIAHAGLEYELTSSSLNGTTVDLTYFGAWNPSLQVNTTEPILSCALPDPDPKNLGSPESGGECESQVNAAASGDDQHVGDPVHAGTGNKVQSELDLKAPGDFPLVLRRTYNSQLFKGLEFGTNWATIARLTVADSTHVLATRGDGRQINFTLTAGSWAADADRTEKLLTSGTGYLLVIDDAHEEVYDAGGHLQSISDPAGRRQTYAYDALGRMSSITDPLGRALSFQYNSANRVASVTDPAGGRILYGYDANNNLTTVTFPTDGAAAAPSKVYSYDESAEINGGVACSVAPRTSLLTGITDENASRYATHSFDCQGRTTGDGLAGGASQVSLAYNGDGTTTVTDAEGTQHTYGFTSVLGTIHTTGVTQPGSCTCANVSSGISYDSSGNVLSRDDFVGNRSCFAYSSSRNLEVARIEGLSHNTACPASPANYVPPAGNVQRVIQTSWHPDWHLPVMRAEPLRMITWVFNGQADPSNSGAIAACAPATAKLPDGKPIGSMTFSVEIAQTQ